MKSIIVGGLALVASLLMVADANATIFGRLRAQRVRVQKVQVVEQVNVHGHAQQVVVERVVVPHVQRVQVVEKVVVPHVQVQRVRVRAY